MDQNVELTAEAVDRMVVVLQDAAVDLQRIAERMRAKRDLSYAADAANTVMNIPHNLRVDLLVARPIRELLKERP